MPSIERIEYMEKLFIKSEQAVSRLSDAVEGYLNIRQELCELRTYYLDGRWMEDYKADTQGELPNDLKRGVLCEDAIQCLLEEQRELMEELKKLLR